MSKKITEEMIAKKLTLFDSKLTNINSKRIIKALKEIIIMELELGNTVYLKNFGNFSTFVRHPRYVLSPITREKKWIGEVPVARFKTSKELKERIKNKDVI